MKKKRWNKNIVFNLKKKIYQIEFIEHSSEPDPDEQVKKIILFISHFIKFKNQNEYEAHLDALGNSIDKNATLESLNIAPSNLDVGNSNAQNESDDSEDDDGELIVEDVTKEQTY